jgi:hypothetical protein
MPSIRWQLACVEPVFHRFTAGWRPWATVAAMKTRAEHNAAAPADRPGRATGMRWSTTPTTVTSVNDPLARPTAVEATPRQEGERWRLRAGRGLIVVEGLALGVLGGVSLAWSMDYARLGADGTPMLGLKVTPLHAGLLLSVGALALLACLGRRTTFVFSALAACGWSALAMICALEVAHHAPGVLGFDPRDSLFYGALSAYNLVTALFLAVPLSKV